MFFRNTVSSPKEKKSELVVVDFNDFSSLPNLLNTTDFSCGLELRLNDREISEHEAIAFFKLYESFTGSNLIFNFSACSFSGDVGTAIASFLTAKYAPSNIKFYFSCIDQLPGIEVLLQALKHTPQAMLSFDFDYSLVINDDIASLLIDAIENNKQLRKFSLNLDSIDLPIDTVNKLLKCLERSPHFLLYAGNCEAEDNNPTIFKKIAQLTAANKQAMTELIKQENMANKSQIK